MNLRRAGVMAMLVLAVAPWCAAEVVPVPPAPNPPAAAVARPSLGVKIDTTTLSGVFDGGLPVAEVLPGGTGDAIGIQVGDLIRFIDGAPMKQVEDVQAVMAKAKVGDAIEVGVVRGPKADALSLKGTLLEKPAVRSLPSAIHDLSDKVKDLASRAKHDPSLPELLNELSDKLGDLQRDLPKAAQLFRQQYPKGRFRVKIVIDITSDAGATDAVELGVGDDATAAAPAPAPGAAATAAAPK